MANPFLLWSSILSSITILSFYIYHHEKDLHQSKILCPFIPSGLMTSILNHGFTNSLFKMMDRIVIGSGIIVVLYILLSRKETFLSDRICLLFLGIAISLFLLSKYIDNEYNSTRMHALTHFLATCILIYILAYDIYFISNEM